MNVIYRKAESNTRPLDIEVTSSSKYVYIRRNINEETRQEDEGKPYTMYVYEEALLTKDDWEGYKNELLYKLINNQDNTEEFDSYLNSLNTPIEYDNGHTYKPKWADFIYFGLLQKGMVWPELFPMKIYDSTGLEENAEEMTIEELRSLALFLEKKKEELFLEYKKQISNEEEE